MRLCPRFCKLHEGQRGLCFVRARQGDQMVLTTYGRSSGFCVDPIEKKPLNHFLPGTPVLSFGTAGCNLTCKFCQNWDISKARALDRIQDLASARRDCRSGGAKRLPVGRIHLQRSCDLSRICGGRGAGLSRARDQDSGGERRLHLAGAAVEFFRHMDAANIDLKGLHRGVLQEALLRQARLPCWRRSNTSSTRPNVWFEITTLLIPGENDSAAEIEAESRWVMERLGPDVPLHFTAFHPDWKMMDTPPTPPQTLRMARRIAMNAGIRYVYTGNIHDPAGQTTYCHACGAALIGRDWYDLTAWNSVAGWPVRRMRCAVRRGVRGRSRELGPPAPADPGAGARALLIIHYYNKTRRKRVGLIDPLRSSGLTEPGPAKRGP